MGIDMEEKMERLQKVMAANGVASRRECEKIILAGRVKVNGKIVTELGTKVGPDAVITIDGKGLHHSHKRYILLYKPVGVVTTMKDPRGRKTVADLTAALKERVYPVGRLDFMTEGLLLMTNDGALAQRMTHPSYHVNKTYEVIVKGKVPEEKLDLLRLGVPLEDGLTAPAIVEIKHYDEAKDLTTFYVTIHEGRNRQVRRMCEFIGYPVRHLKRVQVGMLTLRGMKRGEFRDLTQEEVDGLWKLVKHHE
jgi:23S rRNA pseudouridine2605 synthase